MAERKTSFQSAIELKEAIDRIPSVLSSLGYCENYCDEDIGWEVQEKIGNIDSYCDDQLGFAIKNTIRKHVTKSPEYFTGNLSGEIRTTKIGLKKGKVTQLIPLNDFTDLTDEKVENLYNMANPSLYGDLQKVKTVYDESVRKAREIGSDQFSVEESLLTEIGKIWAFHYNETPSTIVPYKINIYGPGDKFEVHRDTPAKDLIGTFLIGLGDTSTDGGLEIVQEPKEDLEEKGNCIFMGKAIPGRWFAFRPSEYHRVKEIKDGYRAVMSFKIYDQYPDDHIPPECKDHDMCIALSPYLSELFRWNENYAFLLSHEYCLEGSKLIGADANLYDTLQHYSDQFKRIEIIPVIVSYNKTSYSEYWGSSDDTTIRVYVYPLTKEAINYVLDRSKPRPPNYGDFCIINIGGKPYRWQYSCSRGGYAGNEAEPSEVNAIYLHRAILMFRD